MFDSFLNNSLATNNQIKWKILKRLTPLQEKQERIILPPPFHWEGLAGRVRLKAERSPPFNCLLPTCHLSLAKTSCATWTYFMAITPPTCSCVAGRVGSKRGALAHHSTACYPLVTRLSILLRNVDILHGYPHQPARGSRLGWAQSGA